MHANLANPFQPHPITKAQHHQAPRPSGNGAILAAGLGLLAVNAGKALGSIIGMVSPLDPAALSIIALIAFVPAMFFLAADLYHPADSGLANKPEPNGPPFASPSPAFDALCATYGLSPREREVLTLWAAGHRLDYVADQLCVSKNTAKTHVGHIYKKTGTTNREELLQLIKRM